MTISSLAKRLTFAGAGAIALSLAAPPLVANAQDYGGGGQITVYAPRHAERDRYTGAPVDVATESRAVYYGDLDLNAAWGVRVLHARVVRTAQRICDDLNNDPTLIPEDNDDCVRPAVTNAMYQAPIRDELRDADSGYGYRY